jgi:hypothetical protein
MEVVVASVQSTRNTDLGILVRPIQSIPLVACPSHDPWRHSLSHLASKLDRSTGISTCADNDHWALVRLPEGYNTGTARLTGPLRHDKKSHRGMEFMLCACPTLTFLWLRVSCYLRSPAMHLTRQERDSGSRNGGFSDTLQLVISVPFTESQLIKNNDKVNLPSVRRLKGFPLLAVMLGRLFHFSTGQLGRLWRSSIVTALSNPSHQECLTKPRRSRTC